MNIQNLFIRESLTQNDSYPEYHFSTGILDPSEQIHAEHHLLSEHLLDIYIQDVLTIRLTCTARELPELVLGRLLSEGIIHSADEVRHLYLCKSGRRAKVFLNRIDEEDRPNHFIHAASDEESESYVELTPTCCTGTHVMNDQFVKDTSFVPVNSAKWNIELIRQCDLLLKKDFPLHDATRSTHSACLFSGNHCLYLSEDIGRHNAIDKVIGHAMMDQVDLTKCALYTTGRMPVDVVQKVIRSGIPLIAGKETPTAESLELASLYNLTLIGNIRNGAFVLFSGYPPS